MSETNPTLAILSEGWKTYQDLLSEALARLTAEQLALRAAPNLRSIDDIARHLIAVRARWFHNFLDEGSAEFAAYGTWDAPGSPARSANELVSGLAATWEGMHDAVARFAPADLEESITKVRRGETVTLTRGWVVWHVLEHDLHHGGEISFSLGMHGLQAPDI